MLLGVLDASPLCRLGGLGLCLRGRRHEGDRRAADWGRGSGQSRAGLRPFHHPWVPDLPSPPYLPKGGRGSELSLDQSSDSKSFISLSRNLLSVSNGSFILSSSSLAPGCSISDAMRFALISSNMISIRLSLLNFCCRSFASCATISFVTVKNPPGRCSPVTKRGHSMVTNNIR